MQGSLPPMCEIRHNLKQLAILLQTNTKNQTLNVKPKHKQKQQTCSELDFERKELRRICKKKGKKERENNKGRKEFYLSTISNNS